MPTSAPNPVAQIIGTVILALIVGLLLAVWLKEWMRRRAMSPAEREAEEQAAIAKRKQEEEAHAERMRLQTERERTLAEAVQRAEASPKLAVASAPPAPGEWMGTAGVLLILAGVGIYLLSLFANTSIRTDTREVTNLSLQQQQMIGIHTGLALIIGGLLTVGLHSAAERICHRTKLAADAGKPKSPAMASLETEDTGKS